MRKQRQAHINHDQESFPAEQFDKAGAGSHYESGKLAEIGMLAGDGSGRKFWRVTTDFGDHAIVVAPEANGGHGLQEAHAAKNIGSHLYACGIPVPELYGYDEKSGIIIYEDLGDTHLHSVARSVDWDNPASVEQIKNLYCQAVDVLAEMQFTGAESFDTAWCWDTKCYDRRLMLERESGYFIRACWQKMLGQEPLAGLDEELKALADFSSQAPCTYFLHRDFQSRNLMVQNGHIRVIDFQGGRLGPVGYDLASLLIDPYSALPLSFQQQMYSHYERTLGRFTDGDQGEFRRWYTGLRLQRNLQIIGAFAFLSMERNKEFFLDFLLPAVDMLVYHTSKEVPLRLPLLSETAVKTKELIVSRGVDSFRAGHIT